MREHETARGTPEAAEQAASATRAQPGPAGGLGNLSAGNVLRLQRFAGNNSTAALIQRDAAAAPVTAGAGPQAAANDPALLAREDAAMPIVSALRGASAGTFLYGSPNAPQYQPPEHPPSATLTIGDLVPRPTNDSQKRKSFESQGAASAYATLATGPAGAAVVKQDDLWFVVTLTAVSASELKRSNVYRFTPAGQVVAVVGTDHFVFTNRDYTPEEGSTSLRDRAEKDLARTAEAGELRSLVGLGGEPGKTGAGVPAGKEEAFIRTYLVARALEALDQNRAMAEKLAADFKPDKAGKLGGEAKTLIDQSRTLGADYQKLENAERKVGEAALTLWNKHLEGRWGKITISGKAMTYHEWVDDINGRLKAIATSKQTVLAMSPLLAATVHHENTPTTASGWQEKLGWETSTTRTVLRAVTWPLSAVVDKIEKSGQGSPSFKDSELSKDSSEASDTKVAEGFRQKLDGVQQALSKTFAKVSTGDVDYLLGLSGLRSRVQSDINALGPQHKAVKDKYAEMLQSHQMKEEMIDLAGTVVSIGALFLPGGQFISAAIGMGMQMKTMAGHMDQWEASQASVGPTKALADQQQAAKALLMDTVMLAVQAADLAISVNGVLDDIAAGRTPKEITEPAPAPGGAGGVHAPDTATPSGLVGDTPGTLNMPATKTGLADSAATAQFGATMRNLEKDWVGLSVTDRVQRVSAGVNQQMVGNNIPQVKVRPNPKLGGGAQFDFTTWTVEVSEKSILANDPAMFADLVNKAYHESRHAEQWYMMARLYAGEGATAQQIGTRMGITDPSVLNGAVKNPLTAGSVEYNAARAWRESVYGSGAAARNQLLGVDMPAARAKYDQAYNKYLQTRSDTTIAHADRMNFYNDMLTAKTDWETVYKRYRALPEEVDAWGVGHGAEFGFRAPAGPGPANIPPPPPIP